MVNKGRLDKIKVYTAGKPIEELKRERNLKNIYKLASNEIPFSPNYIKEAILKELKNINRYPESNCFYLRKCLSEKLGVREEQLVFGNGSDELIILAIRALTFPKSNVIVGFPTFLIYEIQAKVSGIKVKRIPLINYRYNLEAMAKAVDRNTKIIFIANPDNPHGTYVNHKEVENFLDSIPKEVVVFFDEAYFEFVSQKDFPNSLSIIKKRPNTIVTRTFSKAYGLAGLRIGYAISSGEIASLLEKVREPFNVNRFAQVSAIEALKNKGFLSKVLENNTKEKDFLYREFKSIGISFIESVTNFILIDFKQDTKLLNEYLLERGVIVRELDSWGLKNFFRVTIGTHEENLALVRYLKEYLKMRR
ncbi:MAG: histidinol-phosphate transaminase [Candidatus Omnitrophica bacterium]|nr:histidinol-phosphate transaminase [Candidatus Omnitrophota bacterium]MCM8825938.1 histidinol-phosphate transaminase [Candidatus Omnitrophota bacterium]